MQKLIIIFLVCFVSLYSANIYVTTTADSGPGSFRQAVLDASSMDTIVFDFSAAAVIDISSADIEFLNQVSVNYSSNGNPITLTSVENKLIFANHEITFSGVGSNMVIDMPVTGDSAGVIVVDPGRLTLKGNFYDFYGSIDLSADNLEIDGSIGNVNIPGELNQYYANSVLSLTDGSEVGLGVYFPGQTLSIDVALGTATVSGSIVGILGGDLIKIGEGKLLLTGTSINSISTTLTVSAGVCTVNRSIKANVTVESGATLNGNGSILSNGAGSITGTVTVDAGGSLTPGNSIGTLTLGSLLLDPNAITNIEFDPTSSSLIAVTNTATVAGTLNLIQNPGTYSRSGSYEILSAATLIDTFYLFSGELPGFTFTLSSIDNSIILQYTTSTLSPPPGSTGNIFAFANYLNGNSLASYEYLALTTLSGETLYNALNSASPARNAFPTFVSQQTVFSLSNLLNETIRGKRFLQSHKVSDDVADLFLPLEYELIADQNSLQGINQARDTKYALWIKGFADFAHQDGESQNVPFDFTSEGVLLGFDVQRCSKGLAGFALGYANSQVEDFSQMGKSEIAYYVASLYANYIESNVYLEGAFWGVFHQIDNERNISYSNVNAVAKSAINGWQIDPHLEIGYIIDREGFDFEPYVGVDYVVNWEGGTQETLAGNLNMRQKSNISSMIQFQAGVRFFQSFERAYALFGLKEGISYINRTPFGTGEVTSAIFGSSEFFTLTSFTESQNLGAVSALFFAEVGKKRDVIISLGYEGQFGSEYMLNEVSLSISKSF